MDIFTKLAKEGKIGQWCKRGAWIIAALGTLQVIIRLYAAWGMYLQMQQQQGQQPSFDFYNYLLFNVSSIFDSVIGVIFYFLILYSAGAIINSIFVPDKNDDDVVIEPLEEEEEVVPLEK